MEQQTYDQVLAKIDPERAAQAIAGMLIYLGGVLDWGSDEFAGVTEILDGVRPGSLPEIGDQDDEALKFWGTLSLELGNHTDYEPDEDDEDEVEPGRVDISTWRYLMQQEVRADGQRPWPISVDENMTVVGGLGEDDGSRLIGFQQPGVQSVVLMASAWVQDLDAAVGLEPVFSNGNLFVMQGAVVEATGR
jgi:hypothetical protein